MAESLHCSSETYHNMLISYIPLQNVFGVKKIKLKKCMWRELNLDSQQAHLLPSNRQRNACLLRAWMLTPGGITLQLQRESESGDTARSWPNLQEQSDYEEGLLLWLIEQIHFPSTFCKVTILTEPVFASILDLWRPVGKVWALAVKNVFARNWFPTQKKTIFLYILT